MPTQLITLLPKDWLKYRDLRLKSLQTEPQAFADTYDFSVRQPDSYWQGHLERAAQAQGSWMLFAEKEGQLIASASAVIFDGHEIPTIVGVYVVPEARGQGWGKLLLTTLLEKLKAASVPRVRLIVNVEQHVALTLYQKLGFSVKNQEHRSMGDEQLHLEYIMEKELV